VFVIGFDVRVAVVVVVVVVVAVVVVVVARRRVAVVVVVAVVAARIVVASFVRVAIVAVAVVVVVPVVCGVTTIGIARSGKGSLDLFQAGRNPAKARGRLDFLQRPGLFDVLFGRIDAGPIDVVWILVASVLVFVLFLFGTSLDPVPLGLAQLADVSIRRNARPFVLLLLLSGAAGAAVGCGFRAGLHRGL